MPPPEKKKLVMLQRQGGQQIAMWQACPIRQAKKIKKYKENARSILQAFSKQCPNQPINTNTVGSEAEHNGECDFQDLKTEAVMAEQKEVSQEDPQKRNDYPQDFLTFFQAWPQTNGSKKKAFQVWKKARDKPNLERLLSMIENMKKTDKWLRGIIPHPETWLYQARWETADTEATSSMAIAMAPKQFDPRTIYGDDFEYPKTTATKH